MFLTFIGQVLLSDIQISVTSVQNKYFFITFVEELEKHTSSAFLLPYLEKVPVLEAKGTL